jgi:hypothetical protein
MKVETIGGLIEKQQPRREQGLLTQPESASVKFMFFFGAESVSLARRYGVFSHYARKFMRRA